MSRFFPTVLNALKEEDDDFSYILKIVPIDYKLPTTEEEIRKVAQIMENNLEEDQKWRITLRRRNSPLSREMILESAADEVNVGKVDLEQPDKYICIEVVGDTTYMSFTRYSEISIYKQKRKQERLEELVVNGL